MFKACIDKTQWNDFIDDSSLTDILQSWQWGDVKQIEGWKPFRFVYEVDGRVIIAAQVLLKSVRYLGHLAYIPHGPVFSLEYFKSAGYSAFFKSSEWLNFKNELRKWSKAHGVFMIEIEPKVAINEISSISTLRLTGRNRQPKYKLILDITRENEMILGDMKKNTRYNINYAAKKGVKLSKYSPQEVLANPNVLDTFYELVQDMQKRTKGYPVRSKSYFRKLFEEYKDTDRLMILEVSYENKVIAMNISQFTPHWASSFYAGSNRLYPNLKAPYLLRWESILEAKNRGCEIYDFWGIVPDSKHHKGYSDHKLSFGGQRVDFAGIWAIDLGWKAIIWELALKIQNILIKFKYS